jgi:hypothetical protein
MHPKHLVGLAAFLAAFIGAGSAKAVSLDSLIGTSNQIVVGNTVYSNFSYGGTTPASSVVVTSSSTGLSFTTNTGGWTTPTGNSVISYDVTVTGATVQTVGLGFTATASGGAVASVGETVTDLASKKDYSLQVFTNGTSGNNTDSVTLNPASARLHVIKSIDVASAGTGTATITLVDNTFSQGGGGATPGVPEPASLALLPLALGALAVRRKAARR